MRNYIENKIFNNHLLYREIDPYNPLDLPPYTIRLKYYDGYTPSFNKGTAAQVSSSPNIWDLTYENNDWSSIIYNQFRLIEVLGCNSSNVTNMHDMFEGCHRLTTVPLFDTSKVTKMYSMFSNCNSLTSVPLFNTSKITNMSNMFSLCTSLTTVPLFDTSNVNNMEYMFHLCTSLTSVPLFDTHNVTKMTCTFDNCTSLTNIPLFNTSKVTNMTNAFLSCINVQSGALALYKQASSQANPPTGHTYTFYKCGSNTTTGAAELAQIPRDWK